MMAAYNNEIVYKLFITSQCPQGGNLILFSIGSMVRLIFEFSTGLHKGVSINRIPSIVQEYSKPKFISRFILKHSLLT